ncbi:hypothetical protein FRC08_017712 [Ceratobasidium sp. 394]|nr:hypothetical protein FRC08_017712 [Ceratobasidium sp. 394]
MRTREQVVALVRSPLLKNVSHVHFPAINILTCRRPLGSHIHTLIRQADTLKLASSEPAFYTDIPRHLASLVSSAHHLSGVEVYYGDGIHLPHVDPTAVLAEVVGIFGGVKTLSVRLPGGRPSFAGIEVRPSNSTNHPTPTNPNQVPLQPNLIPHKPPLKPPQPLPLPPTPPPTRTLPSRPSTIRRASVTQLAAHSDRSAEKGRVGGYVDMGTWRAWGASAWVGDEWGRVEGVGG